MIGGATAWPHCWWSQWHQCNLLSGLVLDRSPASGGADVDPCACAGSRREERYLVG